MNSDYTLICILALVTMFSAVCGSFHVFFFGLGLTLELKFKLLGKTKES